MMGKRKFRLIKKYPGGPELNTIHREKIDILSKDTRPVIYYNGAWIYPLEWPDYWEELKEPWLLTEDDMELFYGDTFYTVNNFFQIHSYKVGHDNSVDGGHPYYNQFKYPLFGDKKTLEEWIEENEPRYSLNDIEKVLNHCSIELMFNKAWVSNIIRVLKKYNKRYEE